MVENLSEVIYPAIFVVGLLIATALAAVRSPKSALPALMFFALLAPTSSFVPVITQTMAEHRMYLPLVSVMTLLVLCGHRFLGFQKTLVIGAATVIAFTFMTHARNHDYRSVESIWHDAAEKIPTNFRPWSALSAHNARLGRFQEAEDASLAALECSPGNVMLTVEFARALKQNGKIAQALDTYGAAMDFLPAKGPPNRYKTIVDYATLLLSTGRAEDAIAQFRAAIRIQPTSLDAHFKLADALDVSGRSAEAIDHYEAALRADPSSIETCNNYGNMLIKLGRFEQALHILEQGLALNPASPELRINRSLALEHLGRTAEARTLLQQLLTENPHLATAHSHLAGLLASSHETRPAIDHYRKALANRLDDAPTYSSLAALLLQNDQPVEAATAYEAANTRSPGNAELLYRLANARLQSGDLEQAAKSYEQALVIDPRLVEAHNELGIVYAQLGRMREARTQFEATLKIDPGHARARENLERARTQ